MSDDNRSRQARDNLAAGYAGSGARTREEKVAATFRVDEQMERLDELRRSDPDRFEKITTPTTRLSLGHYVESRSAAEEVGRR